MLVNGNPENDNMYSHRISEDTHACTKKLTTLTSKEIQAYAYPYGTYNQESSQIIHAAGIAYAFTTHPGIVSRATNPMMLPRLNAGSPYVRNISIHRYILRALSSKKTATQ